MLERNDIKMKWFEDARLGLFIHWGLYSATEGIYNGKETKGIVEWIQSREKIPIAEYEKFASNLSTRNFDAEKIAQLAMNAGMKYMVFTAKHHEGFAMYDSEYDDYTITKRCDAAKDPVKEIVGAMRKKGIVPCLYYSHALDFHEKEAIGNTWDFQTAENERDFLSYINGKVKFQLSEILSNYGNIGMIWFDVPRIVTDDIAKDLYEFVVNIQPECIINGRLGGTGKYFDYTCMGDNEAPSKRPRECAETCATMNDSWGYKKYEKNYKKPEEIIKLLCLLVSKGVNLLLNVGPMPDGTLPQECVEILEYMGKWMKVNAEAVHGTKASPFISDFSFGWVAQKESTLYLYIDKVQDFVEFYGLESQVISAQSLKGGKVLVSTQNGRTVLDLRGITKDDAVTVIKLELDGTPKVRETLFQQEPCHIILPGCACVIKIEEEISKKAEGIVNSEIGEYIELANKMSISVNGIVEGWKSEAGFLQWEVEVIEPGEYEATLYSVTSKYQPWVGGHKVRLCCGCEEISKEITEDVIPDGVNRRYFAETGSVIGKIRFKRPGKYNISLYADKINSEDVVGLSVTRIVLNKC